MMIEPTEADFDLAWKRIKAKHDAEHGAGDAERLAERGRQMLRDGGVVLRDHTKEQQQ